MWWYDVDAAVRTVSVTWRRVERNERSTAADSASVESRADMNFGNCLETERETIEQFEVKSARWSLRGQAHYITYEDEPATEASVEASRCRTTLRIEPEQLTLIRHGSLRWSHTFRVGGEQTSTMHFGGMAIPVQTDTSMLTVNVQPDRGHVHLVYRMCLGGDNQVVELDIRFAAK